MGEVCVLGAHSGAVAREEVGKDNKIVQNINIFEPKEKGLEVAVQVGLDFDLYPALTGPLAISYQRSREKQKRKILKKLQESVEKAVLP